MDWKEELEKAEKALGNEKNVIQITFYEGYIKGLKFLGNSQQQLLERLSEKVNELGSRCGTGCRREECRVRNSTVEKVKALIQEEKERL